MSKSVMLAYFAQRAEEHLEYLDVEAADVAESCYKGDISFIPRIGNDASINKLVSDVATHKESIVAFHYSGHASSESIFFDNETGNATGLANMLGQCPNLKFVFLNGCSTWEQIHALFANNVRVVIATRYDVEDFEAYIFSKYFYEYLYDKHETFLFSFQSAILKTAVKENLRNLLPARLKVARSSIDAVTYRGIGPDCCDPVWGLFTKHDNEPILNKTQWLPGKNLKLQLERAYTCGRNPIRGVFRIHYHQSKKVLHYFVIDNLENSPEGVSIKLLFENFTSHYNPAEPLEYFYPTDPNEPYFKEKVIELFSNDRTKPEILERIFLGIHHRPESVGLKEKGFEALYSIPRVSETKQVFIFIRVKEKAFDLIKAAVRDFIESSVKFDESNKAARPQLLFFWHLISENKWSFFGLWPFRKRVAKYFHELKDLSYLHEEHLKSLPPLSETDLSEWISHNDVTSTELVKGIFQKNRANITIMELALREFIKNTRNNL